MTPIVRLCMLLTFVMFLSACDGPFIMMPGGALSGPVKAAPSDWAFSDSVENVQLETRPSDPYSVNVWGVGLGARFMIASARGTEGTWAAHILADSRVRLRVGSDVYELKAELSTDAADRAAFLKAAQKKYDFTPDEEESAEAALFVLTAR